MERARAEMRGGLRRTDSGTTLGRGPNGAATQLGSSTVAETATGERRRATTRIPAEGFIHARVFVLPPHPTGGRAPDRCIAIISGALPSSCRVPIDSCCCSCPGARTISTVPAIIHAGTVVRRSPPTGGDTVAGSVASVVPFPTTLPPATS